MAWYIGWMSRISKRYVSRRRKKEEVSWPTAFLRYMGSGLHAEIGCRKV